MTFAAFRFQEVHAALQRLAEAESLTIVVGAGVSVEASLPSWGGLVERIVDRVARRQFTTAESEQAQRWVAETMQRDELVGAAAVAAAMSSEEQLQSWIATELYGGDGPLAFSPGPIAREIARLRFALGGQIRIVTLNYDDLLERALEDAGGGENVTVIAAEHEPPDQDELSVTHLHGFVGRAGTRGPLVLSEEQYQAMLQAETWQARLMVEALRDTTCLFLGTRLTDSNLLRYLYASGEEEDRRHHVVFVRQDGYDHLPEKVRRVREKAARERWARRGVRAIFLDHFGDVAQFVYEIGRRRELGADYRSVDARAMTWIARVERELLGTINDEAFRRSQPELSARLRDALDSALRAATEAGADFTAEALGVGLWLADQRGLHITNWVTSDRAYQQLATIVPVPVERATNWVSVDSFRRGVRVQEALDVYASRWRYVRGLPLLVEDAEYGRLPIGCMTITSTQTVGSTALETMSETVEARFHQTLQDAAAGLWESLA